MDGATVLRASLRGIPVEIGHAEDAELAAFAGVLEAGTARDVLTVWSLIAFRFPDGRSPEIHALGWREGEANTWITSPLVVLDATASMIATRSGHAYLLGERGLAALRPDLRSHLAYALTVWGFTDVRR